MTSVLEASDTTLTDSGLDLSGKKVQAWGGRRWAGYWQWKGAELSLVSRDIDEGEARARWSVAQWAVDLDLSQQGAASYMG